METARDVFLNCQVQLLENKIKLSDVSTCEKLEQLLKGMFEKCPFDKKVIGKSNHYRSKELGVEFEYNQSALFTLFLYINEKNIAKYPYFLPFGLTLEMSLVDVVFKLGEPSAKHGGKSTYIQLSYERLGLEISFLTTNWEQKQAKMSYICVFQGLSKPAHCAVCRKPAQIKCTKCALLFYCSDQCRKQFEEQHRKFCK